VGENGRIGPSQMLRGATKVTLDDKGRMVVPTRYRELLAEPSQGQLIVTINLDSECLAIFSKAEFEKVEHKLMNLSATNKVVRTLQRLVVGHAQELSLDGHGRMLIPQELRDFAAIERTAQLVGQGRKCELWQEARWVERRDGWLKTAGPSLDELPAEVGSLPL
jgi:MraZ protein